MIVLKFGGTSVGSVDRVRDAAKIIDAQPKPRVAVVSAASGVTNLLLDAARAAAAREVERSAAHVAAIRAKHLHIAEGIVRAPERLGALADLGQLHAALNDALEDVADRGELTPKDSDRIVATGEKAMSVLMAATLRARGTPAIHLFADNVIGTDDRFGSARPDRARTREQAIANVQPLLDEGKTVVITGFIGGAPDGSTTTLGRGGSDYSATLLGAALNADEVQIWTDVPGVLSADPRQVRDARVVPQVSYDEAQELAHFGAKVLHPRTIRPAVALDIPVRILSTFAPKEPGTLVTRESAGQAVKAVTAMKGLMLLNVDVPELEDLAGAASATFKVLHEHQIEVVLASQGSSRRRMTYLVDTITGGCPRIQELIEESLDDVEATVSCAGDVAVVAAIGQGAAEQASEFGRMLGVLERAGIPILAASQQMSNMALVAAVPARNAERAVDVIHTAFIRPQPGSARGRRPRRSEMLSESLRVG